MGHRFRFRVPDESVVVAEVAAATEASANAACGGPRAGSVFVVDAKSVVAVSPAACNMDSDLVLPGGSAVVAVVAATTGPMSQLPCRSRRLRRSRSMQHRPQSVTWSYMWISLMCQMLLQSQRQ